MRSRIRPVEGFELAMRVIGVFAVLVLALLLGRSGPGRDSSRGLASSSNLQKALARATAEGAREFRLEATYAPTAEERDWLRALAASGTRVSWRPVAALPPIALGVSPVVGPENDHSVALLAPSGVTVTFADATGPLDSLVVGKSGTLSITAPLDGDLRVRLSSGEKLDGGREPLVVRPILVLGRADWETKYAIAALEEAGWKVDARVVVAPGVIVGQGRSAPIDTARYAAVVVLDTSLVGVSELARYVRSGGGLVVASSASDDRALLGLAGVTAGELLRAELGALASSNPRLGLTARALVIRDTTVVALERRGAASIAVARRTGAGRVLATGWRETWRWRMQGAEGSLAAHRAWWSSAVSRVAFAPPSSPVTLRGLNSVPVAAMSATLGPPSQDASASASLYRFLVPSTFVLALLSLLGEWASRRLRGTK